MAQDRNDQMADILSSEFLRSRSRVVAYATMQSMIMQLAGLRAYWPFNLAAATTLNVQDASGNGLPLTRVVWDYTVDRNANVVYANLNPAAEGTMWAYRLDEAALDIVGNESGVSPARMRGLTMGCWVRLNSVGATAESVMGKWLSTGNNKSYLLHRSANENVFKAFISGDGATSLFYPSTTAVVEDEWNFVGYMYETSTPSLSIIVNDHVDTFTVGVPATIFSGTGDFMIGANGTNAAPQSPLSGHTTHAFLCRGRNPLWYLRLIYQVGRIVFGL